MPLNDEQQCIMDLVEKGENVFITGPGGCGKTYLLNHARDWCIDRGVKCGMTALTGCAALLIDGVTIHGWGGLGIGTDSAVNLIKNLNKHRHLYKALMNWKVTNVLIIDEISMMSATLYNKIAAIMSDPSIRDGERPPLQLIICGDFAQLPPIDKISTARFCFESTKWKSMFSVGRGNILQLNTCIRQQDKDFADLLSRMRLGNMTESDKAVLMSRVVKEEDCIGMVDANGIRPTILYPHKAKVNTINRREMRAIGKPTVTMKANYYSRVDNGKGDGGSSSSSLPVTAIKRSQVSSTCIKTLDKSGRGNDKVKLCVGAQVMLTVNMSLERGLVNGSRGVVTDIIDKVPQVDFGAGAMPVPLNRWEMSTGGYFIIREQYPLILAWALTCHKAQGATLTHVITDLSKVFEYGQAYVTLSRVKSLEGLSITGIDFKKIRCHPKVKRFYRSINK